MVDMSKHQPQIIGKKESLNYYLTEQNIKFDKLFKLVDILQDIETSILLADDIEPDEFILYQLMLLSNGVNLVGLDMQNNIELNKTEQGYCKMRIEQSDDFCYAKIRKSIDRVKKWNRYEPQFITK
jgi:hypothetical protein